jgi:hypothetical protein
VDWQTVINLVGGAVLAVIGWFARQLWDSVKELQKDIHKLEVDLPTIYATKMNMDTRFDRIDHMFEKLFERLNNQNIVR